MTKKKKSSVELDEPEYKLGISVRVEGEDSADEDSIDQYGLESDDEFYQLSFIQSSSEGAPKRSRRPGEFVSIIVCPLKVGKSRNCILRELIFEEEIRFKEKELGPKRGAIADAVGFVISDAHQRHCSRSARITERDARESDQSEQALEAGGWKGTKN